MVSSNFSLTLYRICNKILIAAFFNHCILSYHVNKLRVYVTTTVNVTLILIVTN